MFHLRSVLSHARLARNNTLQPHPNFGSTTADATSSRHASDVSAPSTARRVVINHAHDGTVVAAWRLAHVLLFSDTTSRVSPRLENDVAGSLTQGSFPFKTGDSKGA